MPRRRVTLSTLTASALELVDRDGLDALTLTAVADDLGVGVSTLYTHVEGVDGLRHLVAVASTDNLTSDIRDAAVGTSGREALAAMGLAYRRFALDHPGQFASTLLPPRIDDDDLDMANRALFDVFVRVYGAAGLDEAESRLAARSTRSAIHGFLALEHVASTRDELEADYHYLLDALQRGLLQHS
jgi:AcrR family transcriptional regulator